MLNLLILPFICLMGLMANPNEPIGPDYEAPRVFVLSQSESFISCLTSEYPSSLLHVCDNDVAKAFAYWRPFTKKIELLARKEGVYTPGTKLWIKAYWDREGRLVHIGYAAKQEGPTIDHARWERVFKALFKDSRVDGAWPSGFYHLGSICCRSNP